MKPLHGGLKLRDSPQITPYVTTDNHAIFQMTLRDRDVPITTFVAHVSVNITM